MVTYGTDNWHHCNSILRRKGRKRWPILALLCATITLCISGIDAAQHGRAVTAPNKGICSSLDIRNSVDSFKQLTGCRVIEGFLQIVLMDKTVEAHFANLTFPDLREITGYLLLYRVNGLRSLTKLFPNLSIIRGHHLFINYALAVYEMLHLQELGLYSLMDIPRGAVFITKNPLLCFIDTIDWDRIVPSGKGLNLISENRQSNACPRCPNFNSPLCAFDNITKQPNCWNSQHCQKTCPNCSNNKCTKDGECCNDLCLGGCDGPNSSNCFACKNVFMEDNNHCVTNCPSDYFKFKDRRCIKSQECYDMPKPRGEMMLPSMRTKPWKPFNGSCIIECPPGYEEVPKDQSGNLFKCERCKGACRKVCDAINVDSIQAAQRLKGCVVINGSLEIQIRGGGNIIKELEDSLSMIEEIMGYLKVVRSLSLVSLNFLRKLQIIRGNELENGKFVLVVLDNQNLAELWDFSRRDTELKIGRGRIFFHFNPKLCLVKIKELQERLQITDVTALEVAENSNGDKVACNITELYASISSLTFNTAIITWKPYSHYDMRILLGYVIYVMEATSQNVSMNDGRDACGGDGWKVYDVEVPDQGTSSGVNLTQILTHLKPYTQYAYYVKTYTIATERMGAQSKINYFRTLPAMPTPPKRLKLSALSDSEIRVEWQPPEQSNGKLVSYIIIAERSVATMSQRDYCKEPTVPEVEKKEPKIKDDAKKKTTQEECTCPLSEGMPKIRKNDQEVQALIEFENRLHDSIYIKKYLSSSGHVSSSSRTKRSISNAFQMEPKSGPSTLKWVTMSNELATSTNTSPAASNEMAMFSSVATPSKYETGNYTSDDKFIYNISSSNHFIILDHLKHYSRYSISVQACRERVPTDLATTGSCSPDVMDSIETLPLESADKIDPRFVEVEVLNDTNDVRLKWLEPNITNGEVLTYSIKFKRVDIENQQPQQHCITRGDFVKSNYVYKLRNLQPGNYSVMIKATTLAKETGNMFTDPIYFFIKETEASMMYQLLLGALFAIGIIVIIAIVLFCALRYFYPDSWYNRKLLFATVNPVYFKPIEGYDKWEISRRKIVFENLLGIGHFGEVYEGKAKGIIQKGVTTKVAIKTLNKSPANHKTWLNFLNEASVMKQFDTHHVVRLLGVVTKGEPLVIMELMAKGDLRTYLRSCRHDVPEEERRGPVQDPPTLKEILQMSAEIADGMLYLADKKFVHRDLAARNCMINAEGTVKIGDFGLTRDVYETDYYRKDSKGHLPVRWMAPESLRDGIFTSRSDVWSYGVVLWEMATLASLPYTGLGNGEVMPYVINGGVMEVPENCPRMLSDLMKLCWQYKYSQRPTFSDLLEILLPHLETDFEEVSYYHTEEARQLRASNAETSEDTPYTPLRVSEDFEDFSLESEEEPVEAPNGYIRRPIALVSTETTSC